MPGLMSLADAGGVTINPKLARVYMVPLADDGAGFEDGLERAFQYWPETLADGRGDVGWQEKPVPGGSHPLVQWTGGGGRRLSFSVVFGRDVHPQEQDVNLAGEADEENVDIEAAIAWLRYFTYPLYEQGSLLVQPPKTLMLVFPFTGLGQAQAVTEEERFTDEVMCVMTTCDITYLAWFGDGTPRVVEAQLEFLEVVQDPGGKISFHSRDSLEFAIENYLIRKQE